MGQSNAGQSNQGQMGQTASGQSSDQEGQGAQQGQSGMEEGSSDGASQGQSGESNGNGTNAGLQSNQGEASTGGGDTAPLTFGPETDLIPLSNLRPLDGIPQVDWTNSVQFGGAPGQMGSGQTVPIDTSGSVNIATPTMAQSQIAPQHREVVKEFFAVDEE
jgi:hypothetical protein